MIPTKAYAAHAPHGGLTPFAFDRRDPGPHDVVIDISHCGVCHTDIHFVNNDWGMSVYPMVPGHEIVGHVRAVGAEVRKLKAGDRAGVGCLVDSCRTCEWCREGLEQHCGAFVLTYSGMEKHGKTVTQGGYSTAIVVDEAYTLKMPDAMPLEHAAPLLCAGITTYSPLRRWHVGPGTRLGVVGFGGLGHMAVKFGASFGADVTVLSTSPGKKQDALKLGAHDFLLTTDETARTAAAGRFDCILDTVSAFHDYNTYFNMLKPRGTLICVGMPTDTLHVPALNMVIPSKSVAGSLIGGIPETQEMLDYCGEHNIAADVEVIAIQEINKAYQRMLNNDVKYRFVIDASSLA